MKFRSATLFSFAILLAASCTRRESAVSLTQTGPAVIGVRSTSLYENAGQVAVVATLEGGDAVEVLDGRLLNVVESLQVRTQDGTEGWLPHYVLCSAREWKSRVDNDHVPAQVVAIGRDDQGSIKAYGEIGEIYRDRTRFNPGQAVWPDITLRGAPLPVGRAEGVQCDSESIYLMGTNYAVARLPIWRGPARLRLTD